MKTRAWLGVAIACVVCVVAAVAAPRVAHADGERIVEIEIVDNTRTTDRTVLLIADVEKGDRFSYQLLDRIRVDLVNSGLFKDVQVIATPVPGGMKLTIIAKDKHSWVIAPTVYLQPGNKGGGFGFAENNLWGANKKLLLYGQIATADSLFIGGYLDPSLGNSPVYFRGDVFLRRVEMTEFLQLGSSDFTGNPEPVRLATYTYLNSGLLLGVNLWKGFALDGRIRGARVAFSDVRCAEGVDPVTTGCDQRPSKDGWDVSTEWKVTFDGRANWYGITTGNYLRLSYETGLPQLGSDWDYWIAYASASHARKFFEEHNFQLKGFAGYAHHMPFQQEFTSGGVNLRGYSNWMFRGDTKLGGTAEYSVPFFKVGPLAFRGLVFADAYYTSFTNPYPDGSPDRHYLTDQTEDRPGLFRVGMGAGFRIYVRSIVMPLLGIDYGYGPQANTTAIYFAVGLTEL